MAPEITDINTKENRSLAVAIIVARAKAAELRAQVDAIYAVILGEFIVWDENGKRITRVENLYLSDDSDRCADIYAEGSARARARGIKPASMPHDHCPALVADTARIDAENALIDSVAPVFGLDPKSLCVSRKRSEFLELCFKVLI